MQVMQMLKKWAREHGNPPFWVVEKDYALSYLLAGIASTTPLRDTLLLKGGTALKKAYMADHRFSEDLDYTVSTGAQLDNVDTAMQAAIDVCQQLLQEQGAFSVQLERLILRQPHPGGQDAFTVRVQFPGQRQALCRLKVEITRDELVLWPPEQLSLSHDFPESLTTNLTCYALEEIVAEKLRALLQSKTKLSQRGWGASRVCRDYYDLWRILDKREIRRAAFTDLLHRKCEHRQVNFRSMIDFFDPGLTQAAQREWSRQLSPFVPGGPDVTTVLEALPNLVAALLD